MIIRKAELPSSWCRGAIGIARTAEHLHDAAATARCRGNRSPLASSQREFGSNDSRRLHDCESFESISMARTSSRLSSHPHVNTSRHHVNTFARSDARNFSECAMLKQELILRIA
jgi:hypothetical protein